MDTRKIAIQRKVMKCMEEHLKGWNHIKEMEKVYDQFVKNLKQIEDLQPAVNNDTKPIAENIRNTREKLITQLSPIIKVLSVYAYDKGMKKLKKKAQLNNKELEKMKPGNLEKQAFSIWKSIDKIMTDKKNEQTQLNTDAQNYGLSGKMVDSLYETAVQFANLRQNYKEEKRSIKKAAEQTEALIKDNNKLLKNRLDNFIYLFEQSQPEFFNTYMLARKNKPLPSDPPAKTEKQKAEQA